MRYVVAAVIGGFLITCAPYVFRDSETETFIPAPINVEHIGPRNSQNSHCDIEFPKSDINDMKKIEEYIVVCTDRSSAWLPIQEQMFDVGDLLVDPHTREVGVLVRRYDILHEDLNYSGSFEHWAWEIRWCGGDPKTYHTNIEDYTESGLKQLVESGLFVLHKQ